MLQSLFHYVWILCTPVIASLSCPVPAQADCHIDKAVYDVTPQDERYLEYLRYENRFDSAAVSYTFGEVRLTHNGQEQKITLRSFANEFRRHDGDTVQGIDPVLLVLGRTESFEISSGDTVRFHRELSAYALRCDPKGRSGGSRGQTGTWTDYYWFTGANQIPDKTEFVLEIVRESDDAVLGTLDSVVVLPNPATTWAPRYGTQPDNLNHVRSVPTGLQPQTKVYLRVSPRRFGPTPLGIVMNKISSWVSLSTLFERTPTGKLQCTHADFDSLRTILFQKIIAFTDSTMLATGHIPDNGKRMTLTSAQRAAYNQRYLILDTMIAGRSLYHEKDSATFAAQYWGNTLPPLKSGSLLPPGQSVASPAIVSITPNPVVGTTVQVALRAPPDIPLQLELYDIGGRRVLQLWSGNATGGVLDLDIDKVYSGTYMLVLSTQDGSRLDARQIVVKH